MRLKGQGGFTLIEVIISAAIGALLLAALTSVVYTSWHATTIASGRVEASSEIRNFEYFAFDDFARSSLPSAGGCVPSSPCTTQPLSLTGVQVSNSTPVPSAASVTYAWDGSQFLDRTVAGVSRHIATDVTAFSWYVDTNGTVVVGVTVTLQGYSQSQTFRFRPELNP